jgi:predicted cupin superfamily sugar epimerase
LGNPIEVLMLHVDGTSERVVVGPDLRGGQRVQLLIPGNTFHTARVIPESFRGWFLGASTEWPGVEPAMLKSAMSKHSQRNIQARRTICARFPGSACVSRAGERVSRSRTLLDA